MLFPIFLSCKQHHDEHPCAHLGSNSGRSITRSKGIYIVYIELNQGGVPLKAACWTDKLFYPLLRIGPRETNDAGSTRLTREWSLENWIPTICVSLGKALPPWVPVSPCLQRGVGLDIFSALAIRSTLILGIFAGWMEPNSVLRGCIHKTTLPPAGWLPDASLVRASFRQRPWKLAGLTATHLPAVRPAS